MLNRRPATLKKSERSSRARKALRKRNRQLIVQQLEERRVLAGYFDQIADEISGPSGVLTQVSSAVDTISSVAKLPLINKKLDQVDEFKESLDDFRTSLDSKLRDPGLIPGAENSVIASKIVELLGPGGAKVLANRVAPATIGVEDVIVDSGPNSVDIVIDLGISDVASFPSSLGLGIDSVPLKPTSGTNGAFKAGVFYRNFRFGYNPTAGPYVNTSASNELELELKGFLPASFSAGLGFLNVKVTDSTPGENPGDEDVTISLKANITDTGITAPALGIDLDFQAHINVQTTFDGMPELATDFKLQWDMPAVSPNAPLDGGGWAAPTLEFNNVTVSVGSFVKNIAQPIAQYVKDVLEPLEPVFNLLETRIPGISDVAETFGQSSIDLISLSNLLALSPNPPTQFIDAMRSAAKLRDLYATLTSLADRNAAGLIRLGNFSVSGPGGNSLLNTSAALSNLGLPDWSSLVTSGGGINFEETKRLLREELGAVGGEIADVLTKIASKAGPGGGDKAGFSFSFPIIENPSKVALGMFLGRDENLVSVGLDINLELKKDIFIKIVPGVSILIRPNASVNAATEIGYDTRGLREAMQPLYAGSSFDPNKLLNGLWISGSTHIDVSGSVGVGPVLGLPDFATVDLVFDVGLNVHAGLYNPSNLPKLRFFTGDFDDGKLFTLSGEGKASLSATIKVGGEIPLVGFVGISKTWTFLETTFFRFTTDSVPMPGSMVNRPVIVPQLFVIETFGEGQKLLRLNTADRATLRDIEEDEKNENFQIEVVGYAFRLGQLPAFVPVIDVKAFGIVQRYTGQVDYIMAEMGDGNDTVQVTDWHTKIRYSIHGDEGNDNINVDGNVPVYITGGDENDTIDGGNGTAPTGSVFWDGVSDGVIRVDGGNGRDIVSFGDGRLENVDPNSLYYEVLNTSTDSIRDTFRIDNERSETDTEYQIDTAGSVFGDLLVQPKNGGAPSYAFRFHATVGLEVFSGTGDDAFLGFPTPDSSLYGGYGDDVFRPLAGLGRLPTRNLGGVGVYPSFNVNFYGGNDNDVLIVDDSRNTTPRQYNINSDNWSNAESRLHWTEVNSFDSGVIRFSGIDDFDFKSGSESDSILISGVITAGLTIDSGSGNDRIVVGYLGPGPVISGVPHPNPGSASIRGPMTINSGTGDDTFELNNVSNRFMEYETIEVVLPDGSIGYRHVPSSTFSHYIAPLNLEGGIGNNTLQIDDRQRRLSRPVDINQTNYHIKYDQFNASTIYEADDDAAIHFNDVELRSVHLSNDPVGYNNVNIVSLGDPQDNSPPTDLPESVSIYGYEAVDSFKLFPHDLHGNATLLRPIVLDGGSKNNFLQIDDSNSQEPVSYGFQNFAGTSITGITPGQVSLSSTIVNVVMLAGDQSDTFELEYTGSIQSLALFGGLGDDVFEVSPDQRDLASLLFRGPSSGQIISMSLVVDGGDGRNGIKLFNDNNPFFWEYFQNESGFIAHSPSQSVVIGGDFSGLQSLELSGGLNTEIFYIDTVGSGETMIFSGNLGQDSIVMGQSSGTVSGIAGQVIFDAGSDGGQARVWNQFDSRDVIAHIAGLTDTLVGATNGDTLFAPGGSLRVRNLRNHPSITDETTRVGLFLGLGAGADSIFVEAQNYGIRISGNDPAAAPGDTLHLSLANLLSPLINLEPLGVSRLQSDNRETVEWYRFENLDTAYVAPTRFLVTNTLDSGPGSLRQALMNANVTPNVVGPDQIHFAIPGFGVHTIQPLTQLPIITDTLVLDATTQPGYSGTPLIELDGSLAGNSYGLFLFSGGNTIRGLAINRFVGVVNAEILIQGPGGNVIQGNYLGTNLAGNAIFPIDSQADYGVAIFGSTNNIIGTDANGINDASERNVISGNREAGIYLNGDGNVVAGNFIGTTASGAGGIGNGDGIVVNASSNNRIGGSMSGAGNVIANNSQSGVVLSRGGSGNSILGNSIFDNGYLGINLSSDNESGIVNVTPNDAGDSDDGVNHLQNFPEISTALATATQTIVGGKLQSTPNTLFRVEFFSSATKDPSGHGEGQTYLGFVVTTTDSTGVASFVTNFETSVPLGQFISSTATDPLGNTSEFSWSTPVVPKGSLTNVVALQLPTNNKVFLVTSPVGTSLTASIKPNAEVPPPNGLNFPYGFLDFIVTGLVPGSSADVSVSGLDLSQIRDYYKLGPTPGNGSMHWYSFMFGQGNPSDNPGGTGMEVVGGTMVLHLIDGKRGDDDLQANGIIVDIGGPVSHPALVMGSISGVEYLDITGNGLTSDDSPLAEVKVFLDTNHNGVWDTGEPTRLTLADGSYLFTGLPAGTYKVRQITPTGYVRTAPATVDYYSVVLAAGQTSSLNRFANAAKGNLSALSNVVYLVNGTTPVSDLSGSTTEGDTIQVSFTIRPGAPDQRLTLVSYTAPSSSFNSNTAFKQKIFDTDTNVFGPGTHTLTVSNPHSYFQIDFVSGYAIDKFGPSGSNVFYTAQNRLVSADNGGTRAVLASPASLTGSVYRDANNNGTIDAGEQAIAGVKVTVSSGSLSRSVVTDVYGVYLFDNLSSGTYVITETQPGNYIDGKETLGNKGGTVGSDKFTGIVLAAGASGTGYHFGEQQTVGLPYADNQTQSASWWNSSNGQSLIKALNSGPSAKNLGNWLASNFSNLFGANAGSPSNLAGKTNSQVAAFYRSLYSNASKKPESEALALAFNIYVTNTGLASTKATYYGFAVSIGGLGIATANVDARGTALGVNNDTDITIAELLSRANALSRTGVLWDANGDHKISSAENVLRSQAFSLISRINSPLPEGEGEYQLSLDESSLPVNPWLNDSKTLDVNGDNSITPLDALLVINQLNLSLNGDSLFDSKAVISSPYIFDVNGDDIVSPLDVLLIINFLNDREVGEGESSSYEFAGNDTLNELVDNTTSDQKISSYRTNLGQADSSDISTVALPIGDRDMLQTGNDVTRIGKRDSSKGRLDSLDLFFGELETDSFFDDIM